MSYCMGFSNLQMKLRSYLPSVGLILSVASNLKQEFCLTESLAQLFSLNLTITVGERNIQRYPERSISFSECSYNTTEKNGLGVF